MTGGRALGGAPWMIARVLVVALALLASGCVEYHERIVIERDGSGEATLRLGIDETLSRLAHYAGEGGGEGALRAAFTDVPGITVRRSRTYVRDGLRWQELALHFDSLARLDAAGRASGQDFRFAADGKDRVVFERRVDLRRQEGVPGTAGAGESMLKSLLGDYHWTFEVRFPAPVLEANTPPDHIDTATHTVRWDLPLADFVGHAVVLRAVVRRPARPLLGIAAGVGTMLVLTAIAAWALRRRRKAGRDDPAGVAEGSESEESP